MINCADNQNLFSLNIMGLEELEYLDLSSTGIKDLKVKSNKRLLALYVDNTEIGHLDVSGNSELWFLYCSGTKIT